MKMLKFRSPIRTKILLLRHPSLITTNFMLTILLSYLSISTIISILIHIYLLTLTLNSSRFTYWISSTSPFRFFWLFFLHTDLRVWGVELIFTGFLFLGFFLFVWLGLLSVDWGYLCFYSLSYSSKLLLFIVVVVIAGFLLFSVFDFIDELDSSEFVPWRRLYRSIFQIDINLLSFTLNISLPVPRFPHLHLPPLLIILRRIKMKPLRNNTIKTMNPLLPIFLLLLLTLITRINIILFIKIHNITHLDMRCCCVHFVLLLGLGWSHVLENLSWGHC